MSELDIVVWGASGFTGRLVARYLARSAPADVTWAIAGRNESKLRAVAREAGADVPIILADSNDPRSLRDLVSRARVICTTVGPYARYGSDLVAACAEAGVHYCDLTGEVQWMRRMIDQHHHTAAQSGARIVHTCGFDSIPFDLGVHFVQREMRQRHGIYATRVKARVGESRGGASGGTIDSMMTMYEEAARDPGLRDLLADPYSLNPLNMPRGPDGEDQRGAEYDYDFASWTAPFVMAAINTRVVRRSHALKGYPFGADFSYSESMLTANGPGGFMAASAVAGVSALVGGAMALSPLRDLFRRFAPAPGEGPGESTMTNGFYSVEFLAVHPDDATKNLRAVVRGDMDPGYGSTSKMLAESALCLARDELASGGGVLTPAYAMGDALIARLHANTGVTFEVSGS